MPSTAPAISTATVMEVLAEHAGPIDRQLSEVVKQEVDDRWLRQAIGYHLGWLDEHFVPVDPATGRPGAGGKKVRAALALLAHQATATVTDAGRPDEVRRAVPFAAAVELIHNWSLVHDDIQDGDRTRRGRPTVWALWGEGQAINVGNCLHDLAFRCLARLEEHGVDRSLVVELMAELARTSLVLNVGQSTDLASEATLEVDSGDYLATIAHKTAGLISCATYGGALLASPGDRAPARDLAHYGHELGLSFQIRDDILGIWATDRDTGKPTGTDIRRRKKTLPVVLALERAGGSDRERLRRLYAPRSPLSPADERDIREVLDRCGVRDLAQLEAHRHRARAVAALAPYSGPAAETLRALADFVTDRTH